MKHGIFISDKYKLNVQIYMCEAVANHIVVMMWCIF